MLKAQLNIVSHCAFLLQDGVGAQDLFYYGWVEDTSAPAEVTSREEKEQLKLVIMSLLVFLFVFLEASTTRTSANPYFWRTAMLFPSCDCKILGGRSGGCYFNLPFLQLGLTGNISSEINQQPCFPEVLDHKVLYLFIFVRFYMLV